MPEYEVNWLINEEAPDPETAARQARARLLDPESIADVFYIIDEQAAARTVDLSALDGRCAD